MPLFLLPRSGQHDHAPAFYSDKQQPAHPNLTTREVSSNKLGQQDIATAWEEGKQDCWSAPVHVTQPTITIHPHTLSCQTKLSKRYMYFIVFFFLRPLFLSSELILLSISLLRPLLCQFCSVSDEDERIKKRSSPLCSTTWHRDTLFLSQQVQQNYSDRS